MSNDHGQSSAVQGSYAYTNTLKGVYYGPGCIKIALPKLLESLGGKKVMIVTGQSLYNKTDVVKTVESILGSAHVTTFYDIGQHAPIAGIKKGIQAFHDSGADIIVSVGGGSPIDASKAIIHMLHEEDKGSEWLKQIAVPTTLSAAEYTVGAGFSDENNNKVGVSGQELAPAGVILDAELTLATPERLWLSTGMRAMDHAVENLYRPLVPPPVKYLCYAAIVDLFKYLPISKANPKDLEARQKLQIASWMSLWPLKLEKYSALGLSHALGHKLGAKYAIAHGITSCLTLAAVVDLKATTASEEDKATIAATLFYLQIPSTGSVDGDVRKVSQEIDGLVTKLGLKSTLKEYNVPKADFAGIAEGSAGGKDKLEYDGIVKLLEGIY